MHHFPKQDTVYSEGGVWTTESPMGVYRALNVEARRRASPPRRSRSAPRIAGVVLAGITSCARAHLLPVCISHSHHQLPCFL